MPLRSRIQRDTASLIGRPPVFRTSRAWAMTAATDFASTVTERSTNPTRPPKWPSNSIAACAASRVLPTPPAPVRVINRTPSSVRRRVTASTSLPRPIRGVTRNWRLGQTRRHGLGGVHIETVPNRDEFVEQAGGGRKAVGRILRQAPLDGPLQRQRAIDPQRSERARLGPQDCRQRFASAVSIERTESREHFVKEDPERELIGTVVEEPAADLLGRHVTHRSPRARRIRRDRGWGRIGGGPNVVLRHAEVEQLRLTHGGQHDVVGLDVAMHHAAGVGGGKGAGDGGSKREHPPDRQWTEGERLTQRLALHVLHDDEVTALGLSRGVHGDDVRVSERRGCARFAQHALASRAALPRVRPKGVSGRRDAGA